MNVDDVNNAAKLAVALAKYSGELRRSGISESEIKLRLTKKVDEYNAEVKKSKRGRRPHNN